MESLTALHAPADAGLLDGAAVSSLRSLLTNDPVGATEVRETLRRIDSSINQLQGLRLTAVAAASRSQVGAADGLVDVGAWVARESRLGGAEAARSVRLASSLDSLPHAGDALAGGLISVQHAEVIAAATRQLPPDLSPVERDRVEAALTEQAKIVDPTTLRKASRRAVAIAGRSIVEVDARENQVVRTAEEVALLKTKLSMHDNDDDTVTGHFTVPTFAGAILRKAVQQITAPRRAATRAALEDSRSWTRTEDHQADWAHKYGLALVELLEHLPTDRLHAKVAATVVVTMDVDQLRGGLKVAGTDVGRTYQRGRPASWRVTPPSCRPSSTGPHCRWIWADPTGSSATPSAPRSPPDTTRARRWDAIGPTPGPSFITNTLGSTAGKPTWIRRCRCVGSTTAKSTTPVTSTPSPEDPTALSESPSGRERDVGERTRQVRGLDLATGRGSPGLLHGFPSVVRLSKLQGEACTLPSKSPAGNGEGGCSTVSAVRLAS